MTDRPNTDKPAAAPATTQTLHVFDDKRSILRSVASDALTFGGLVATALALNTLMSPSAILNTGLAVAWILWLMGRGIRLRKTMTPKEAMAWLKQEYPDSL